MVRRASAVGLVAIVAAWAGGAAQADLRSDLQAYWQFDGGGQDSSAFGRDLDLYGNPVYAPGLFGSALDLPGDVGQYAQRPIDDPAFNYGDGDFTIQAWVNYHDTSGEQVLIEKFYGGAGSGWTLTKLDWDGYRLHYVPSEVIDTPQLSITTDTWHQVIARRTSNVTTLWFDGTTVASQDFGDATTTDSSEPLLIGRRNSFDGRGFATNGSIDEVAVWSRALTSDEIVYLYNQGSGNLIKVALLPGDANGDGKVDIADLSILLTNFDKTGMSWSQGDFDHSGTVDIADLSNLLTNFDKTAASSACATAVAEPSSLALLGLGVICLFGQWWRRRRACGFLAITVVLGMLVCAASASAQTPLLSYWAFNDGSGTTVLNTGTLGTAYNGVLSVASNTTGSWAAATPNTSPGAGVPLPTWTTGRFDGALAFSGYVTDPGNFALNYVAVPGTGGPGFGGGGLDGAENATMSMWVKWNGTQYTPYTWENGNSNPYPDQFGAVSLWQRPYGFTNNVVGLSNADPSAALPTLAGGTFVSTVMGTTPVGTGWNNIVTVCTAGTWTMYMNGAQLAGSPTTGTLGSQDLAIPLSLGANYFYYNWEAGSTRWGTAGPGNDTMCDVGIFGGALSPGMAKAIYNVPTNIAALGNYSLGALNTLFGVYETGTPAAVGSLTWSKTTSLSGHQAGDAWQQGSAYCVQFGDDGSGVTAAPVVHFPGDANLDGKVDIADLSILLTNFDKPGMSWSQGDFDNNGTVDIADLSNLLTNFDKTAGSSAGGVTPVPEPSALVVLGTGAAGLLAYRWRRLRASMRCGNVIWAAAAIAGLLWIGAFAQADSYDLRTYGRVTPVKDQNPYGNCWSYAAISSVESNMLSTGLLSNPASPSADFSETHLSRFYGGASAALPLAGGNRLCSLSYFASGRGPVLESQYPFPGNDGDPYASHTYAPQSWVTSQQWIDRNSSYHAATIQDIKNAIVSQGAVESDLYWDQSWYDPIKNSYCYSGSPTAINHGISLVGWDDSKQTQSGSQGAWLVKNSWGTSFGNNGYFWLSYNDTAAVQDATSYRTAAASTYSSVLQNETSMPTGWWNFSYGAAKFTTQNQCLLKGVGFAASNYGVQYDIKVYSSWSGGAPSGLLSTATGAETWPGYYVVNFASPINVAANSGFVISLHVTASGGSGYNIGVDTSCGDLTGVDYFSNDGVHWSDMGSSLGGDNILFLKALVSNALLAGDANGDGKVDIADLSIILTNFDKAGMNWAQGDFDSSGTVDIADLSSLLTNFDKTAAADAGVTAVPEPSGPLLIVAGVAVLLARAWRRRRA
jgi:C1A family cysteine protease